MHRVRVRLALVRVRRTALALLLPGGGCAALAQARVIMARQLGPVLLAIAELGA